MSKYYEEDQLEIYAKETRRKELKDMLEEIIPHIKGKWFIGKGGLLGIVRNGDLILDDHDLDLYLLPGTRIELPEGWDKQKYYVDQKIYRKKNFPVKLNTWLEYLNLTKTKHPEMNRAAVMKEARKTYDKNKIKPCFTLPWFDIYYLEENNDRYEIYFWTEYYGSYFTKQEVENIQKTNVLGFEVNIPYNAIDCLERHFGKDWKTPNRNYKKDLTKCLKKKFEKSD